MPGQAPDTAIKTGTDKVIPGHNHILTDTAAQVDITHIEAIPGHDTGIIATTPGVTHDSPVPHTGDIAIDPAMTHHIHPHLRSSVHRSFSSYHSRDQSRTCSHPSYKTSR